MRAVCAPACLALALAPSAQARADDGALLARFAPVLHYDSAERDRATSVEALTVRRLDARGRPGDRIAVRPAADPPATIYGHVVRGRRVWLQYWMLYATNPQDRGIVRTGRHEGDWEVAQVALDRGGRPERAVFAQHSWAEACTWQETRHPGGHLELYVANGSHAVYAAPGTHDRPWPDPNDHADGRGATARPTVVPITARRPAWVAWPGRWGRSDARFWIPGEKSSPRGPAFQSRGPWHDPDAYLARARACGSGAPPGPRYAVLAVAVGLGGAMVVALRLRRRRRTE